VADTKKTILSRKAAESNSDEARKLADELNKRIEAWEEWINRLFSKPDLRVTGRDAQGIMWVHLRLARSGETHRIFFSETNDEKPPAWGNSAWKPLVGSPLWARIDGVKVLPLLVEALRQAQENEVELLRDALATLDQLGADVSGKGA
jgi:hypothetical protein